jgi:hypothetical protein
MTGDHHELPKCVEEERLILWILSVEWRIK